MNKKLFFTIGLAIAIIFSFSVTMSFATENTMQDAGNNVVNGVRDVVGGAENAVEDAVKDVGNDANTAVRNTTGYNAARTATDTNTANTGNFLGMTSTMWTWIIIAVAAAVIVALIWYYSSTNTRRTNYYDDDNNH